MTWAPPCNPPAHVFAENVLAQDQRNILRVVYREAYDHNVPPSKLALFRAYASPSSTALVLHILCKDLRTFETSTLRICSLLDTLLVGQAVSSFCATTCLAARIPIASRSFAR